jgi:hypothetical protein
MSGPNNKKQKIPLLSYRDALLGPVPVQSYNTIGLIPHPLSKKQKKTGDWKSGDCLKIHSQATQQKINILDSIGLNIQYKVQLEMFTDTSKIVAIVKYVDNYYYLPSSWLDKVNCETGEVISSSPELKLRIPQKISAGESIDPNKYGIISLPLSDLKLNVKKTSNGTMILNDLLRGLQIFDIVKFRGEPTRESMIEVTKIFDKTKFTIPFIWVTKFTPLTGQKFKTRPGNDVTVRSIDIDTPTNLIIQDSKTHEYGSINPSNLIRIKGANPVKDQSYFYTADIKESDNLDTNLNIFISLNEEHIDFDYTVYCNKSSPRYTIDPLPVNKFKFTEDCFIEFIYEEDKKTIYIEKFMCSGALKGTGKKLLCDFLCYIINTYPDAKFITLVAQPHYVSDSRPFRELVKLLQKLLNDYYRSCGFLKIDVDNEFMGYIPDLIARLCPDRIIERQILRQDNPFLNDLKVAKVDPRRRVGHLKFPTAWNYRYYKKGGSKRRTKKRIRRKSIKKNNFFEKKRKRRKSKKKRK